MFQLAWSLLGEEPAYRGFTTVLRQTYRMPDGNTADWDVVRGGRSVAVVARTVDGLFVTARQFRPGPGRVLDELPGGYVGNDEDVAEAAARELAEETGYVPGEVKVVGSAWLAANSQLEQFCAVATGCTPTGVQSPDPLEFTEVRLKTLAEFVAQVRRGGLTDSGLAYRGLDYLGVLRLD